MHKLNSTEILENRLAWVPVYLRLRIFMANSNFVYPWIKLWFKNKVLLISNYIKIKP